MKNLIVIILFIAITAIASNTSRGQLPAIIDDTDLQSWNDVSISKKLNDKVDVVAYTTFRFTKNVGRLNEGRIGGGFVFKAHRNVSVNPTYLFIKVRDVLGRFVTENRLTLAATYRFPLKKIGLSHRSQAEYRIRSNIKSWRYRPSISIEKSLPETFAKDLKLYVTEEPFYDSITRRFSRNRLTFGVNKAFTKHLSLDAYYLRQDDRNPLTRVTHVIGTGWKIKF